MTFKCLAMTACGSKSAAKVRHALSALNSKSVETAPKADVAIQRRYSRAVEGASAVEGTHR